MLKLITLSIVSLLLSSSIYAAKPANIGTGSEAGNYYSMVQDIMSENYCKDTLGKDFNIILTGGSVDNLLGLSNKKFFMGVVQSDVLMNMSKTSPRKFNMNSIKIVAGLHNETIHLLVPMGYQPKTAEKSMWGKISSFNSSKEPMEIKLEVLANQSISSWGGSIISAKALSYFFNLNWKVKAISEKITNPLIKISGWAQGAKTLFQQRKPKKKE